ncbi:pseudouridine synthase [Chitinimonas koreensis]|uniref:pseudouridine synthase n=1 Tax=Chitinimonas koreensis TaxID=356302 RepID=UPI000A02CDE5|nr:pseudouridine synthase [Chitinimonas koreensis]QNM98046.1 pseudouridine synthase [Chitinimonas koreensis]
MAPPRKPAPRPPADRTAAPAGGRGRSRPPQGESERGGEGGRRAPSGRYGETPRDAGGQGGRGRQAEQETGRAPRAATGGRGGVSTGRGPADRGPADRNPSERSPSGRSPAGRGPADRDATGRGAGDRGPAGKAPAERGATGRAPAGKSRIEQHTMGGRAFGSVEQRQRKRYGEDEAGPAPTEAPRRPRNAAEVADLPVERAKKMRVRHGSEQYEKQAYQLREKRVEAHHVGELRIQKALALSGIGSRRDCDEWVAKGRVSINGAVVEPGARVKMGDRVLFDGKPVNIKWPDRLPRVVLYHKQEGELVSRDDPEGRTTVFERLPRLQSSAWVAVGRLDFNTSGLLIFTTSGDLANRLTHPRFEVQREYAVRVLGQLTEDQRKQLIAGIELEDGPARFEVLEDQGGEGKNHWYRVILKEGRNREVRRMFEHFELQVSRLMRVRFGLLTLPSRLKRGQYYELDEPEVLAVLKWAGLGLTGRVPTR